MTTAVLPAALSRGAVRHLDHAQLSILEQRATEERDEWVRALPDLSPVRPADLDRLPAQAVVELARANDRTRLAHAVTVLGVMARRRTLRALDARDDDWTSFARLGPSRWLVPPQRAVPAPDDAGLHDAIRRLPDLDRVLAWLRFVDGLSGPEMGILTEMAVGSVRSRLAGAARALDMK